LRSEQKMKSHKLERKTYTNFSWLVYTEIMQELTLNETTDTCDIQVVELSTLASCLK